MKAEEAKIGGKIHKILNLTLFRVLTRKEYTKLVELMQKLLVEARKLD